MLTKEMYEIIDGLYLFWSESTPSTGLASLFNENDYCPVESYLTFNDEVKAKFRIRKGEDPDLMILEIYEYGNGGETSQLIGMVILNWREQQCECGGPRIETIHQIEEILRKERIID